MLWMTLTSRTGKWRLEAPECYGALQQMEAFLWGSRICLWLQIPGVVTLPDYRW